MSRKFESGENGCKRRAFWVPLTTVKQLAVHSRKQTVGRQLAEGSTQSSEKQNGQTPSQPVAPHKEGPADFQIGGGIIVLLGAPVKSKFEGLEYREQIFIIA